MSVLDALNVKGYSSSKRSRRYGDPRWKRKSNNNGATLRRKLQNADGWTFSKTVRTQREGIPHWAAVTEVEPSTTPFEESVGIRMQLNLDYSLNKKKRWETIYDHVNASDCDELFCKAFGEENYGLDFYSSFVGNNVFLAYFNDDDNNNNDHESKYNQKYFWNDRIHKIERVFVKSWRKDIFERPSNLDDQWTLFRKYKLRARSCDSSCQIKSALVSCHSVNSYWSPSKVDDDHDYLDIDLGETKLCYAISTRGRPLKRYRDPDSPCYENEWKIDPTSPVQYVRRYRLYVRRSSQFRTWEYLGTFHANSDSESEVANLLTDSSGNASKGIFARYFRIQPLSKCENGFYKKKVLRVGIYGEKPSKSSSAVDMTQLSSSSSSSDSDSDSDSDTDTDTLHSTTKQNRFIAQTTLEKSSNKQTITNKSIPATIICIRKLDGPKSVRYSNYSIKYAPAGFRWGTHSCSCRGCKRRSIEAKKRTEKRKSKISA